jgi:hypothetical protein
MHSGWAGRSGGASDGTERGVLIMGMSGRGDARPGEMGSSSVYVFDASIMLNMA